MDGLRDLTVLVVLLAFPGSWGAAIYCWRLWGEDRIDYPGASLRFSLILAITSTLAAIGASLLAISALAVLTQMTELRLISLPSLYIAVIILDVIPIINAAYLRVRRGTVSGVPDVTIPDGFDGKPLKPDS